MVEIIRLKGVKRPHRQSDADKTVCEIIPFTGIRYERPEGDDRPAEARPRPTSSRRRRRKA